MSNGSKVVINLSSGAEDPEAVTVACLVADAAVASGKQVVLFLTKKAVRLGIAGHVDSISVDGYPAVSQLIGQITEGGADLHCCPPCFKARNLDESQLAANAKVSGAKALFEWIGEGATVLSY